MPPRNRAGSALLDLSRSCGNDLGVTALDDCPDAALGMVVGPRTAAGPRLGPCDREPPELVPLIDHVHDAPVGEVPHDQLGDSLHGGLMVERRGELVAGTAKEIEPRLPLGGAGGSGPLRDEKALALVF